MSSFKVRYVLAVACMLAALSLWCASAVAAQPKTVSCEITSKRPARTFFPGEPIQLTVRLDGPRDVAVFTITDYRGRKRAGGYLRAGRGHPALLKINRKFLTGIYFLRLAFRSGLVVTDAFCVLPRPDENVGDRRLFGVHWRPRNDAQWQALAQMGARHLRAEVTWPDTELVPGEYDFTTADMYAEGARKVGLQLTVLSGHTPRFYSMRPLDGEGRVATAWHTWPPADTIEWSRFTEALASRLLHQTVSTPLRDLRPKGSQRPLVLAWEVWSEADQNFYYGTWERYLDMLRIAYCTVKRHAPRTPVIYGSCGHWTEAVLTVQAGCADYFDLMAYHPNGPDPDWALENWLVNMPQVMLARGRPRESAYTETHFIPDNPDLEASFQLRLYATLKAWRQRFYIRTGCVGALIGQPNVDEHAFLWEREEQLIPRPGYVGFAVTRWLLEDAHYVGPLDLAEGARLELFLKHGRPLVVAWGDPTTAGVRVPMRLLEGAQLINAMGEVREIERTSYQVPAGPEAVALWGVDYDYVRLAARLAMERVLTTELGFYSDHNSSYVDPLEQDAARWVSPSFPAQVRHAVRTACRESRHNPTGGPAAFRTAERVVGAGMVGVVHTCQSEGDFDRGARNTIWRLGQYVEDLGMIADGLAERWPGIRRVSEQEMNTVRCRANNLRRHIREENSQAECAYAERLIDRALEQLAWAEESSGLRRGAWQAAKLHLEAAEAVAEVEPPLMRRVFVASNFPTGQQLTKATLLQPDPSHHLGSRVYNFLDRPVSGTLKLQVPDTWGGAGPTVAFSVPAHGVTEPLQMPFSIPEQPRPWVTKTAWRPWNDGRLLVHLPQPIEPNADLWVSGETSVGPDLPDMRYRVCVGAYAPQSQPVQIAVR